MAAAVFLDTNLLVYPHDRREPERAERAVAVLDELAGTGRAALSTQVLGEFFWVVTRRLPDPLPPVEAAASVERHARSWVVLDVSLPVVREALRGVREHTLPYWDALIWASAKLSQIPLVLSEDFADGRDVEGVRFANPFADGFQLGSI